MVTSSDDDKPQIYASLIVKVMTQTYIQAWNVHHGLEPAVKTDNGNKNEDCDP